MDLADIYVTDRPAAAEPGNSRRGDPAGRGDRAASGCHDGPPAIRAGLPEVTGAMRAMILRALSDLDENPEPLEMADLPVPVPGAGEVLIRVTVCGVCHTELDEIEGRTPPPRLPVILGHQVVGRVEALGDGADGFAVGDRVGVAWIYSACGACTYCRGARRTSATSIRATGRDANGGYAELMTVPAAFAHADPRRLRRRRGRPPALRRRDRLPLAAADRPRGRPEPGPDGLRRLGPPGPEAGPASLPQHPRLRLRPQRGRAGLRPRAGRRLGRRHRRGGRPRSSTPSSTRPPPGRRSSRRSRTWSAAGGW